MSGSAPLLSIRALSHAYGTAQVLDAIALDVQAGEWVGLLGVNGAGKSTLLRCVAGLLRLQGGQVLHQDIDLSIDPVAAKCRFGFAVEPSGLPADLTMAQYLELVTTAHGELPWTDTARRLHAGFGLEAHAGKRLSRCSLGTQQKTAIVAAFVGRPALVILDEPFNALDAQSQLAAKMAFADFSRTGALLMASHTVELMAQWCTRIVRMDGGSITESIDVAQWRRDDGDVRRLEAHLVAGKPIDA